MSDQQHDERGIDEILASIDEMLNEKQIYEYKPSQKEELSALQKIKQQPIPELPVESVHKQNPEDSSEEEAEQLPQKIVLTTADEDFDEVGDDEEYVSSVNEASLEEVSEDQFDLTDDDLPDSDFDSSESDEEETDIPEIQVPEVQAASDEELVNKEEKETVDDTSTDEQEAADAPETAPGITRRHRIVLTEAFLEPSAQEALPLWIEQEKLNKSEVPLLYNQRKAKPVIKKENPSLFQENRQEENAEGISSVEEKIKQAKEQEDAEQHHEPIERNELVEAIVHDALQPEELSSAVKHEMAAIISKYELNQLANIITEEVTAELQKQIQENLPKLIQKSLRQHFELLDKDTE